MKDHSRALVAELVGTFMFVFIGAGSIVIDTYTHGALGLLGIAVAHGLALSIVISICMGISGGHINPAVTAGLWLARKIDTVPAIRYVAAQLLGAVLAGFLLRALYPGDVGAAVHLGTPALAPGVIPFVGLVLEAILTFFLMLAVLGTAVDSIAPKIGGFGIGLTVAADILAGGPITGASMNPARSFGPALASGYWDFHWLYWIGPLAGALAASWLYTRFISKTV
jgi:MIP family channel proteins